MRQEQSRDDAHRGLKPAPALPGACHGFTLIEALIVIVITGIIAAVVAVFVRKPVEGYFDAVQRAELTDIADTALRRMARDIRLALPNSTRVTTSGGNTYLELLIASGGGRYRADFDSGGLGNPLDFTAATTTFDVLGPVPGAAGDSVVVFNLGAGFSGADAYQAAGNNRQAMNAPGASSITLTAAKLFPFESPGKRFHVVRYAVTYECAPNAGNPAAGVIRRYWSYGINAVQGTPPAGGSNALLASQVKACSITYDSAIATQRAGVVAMALTLEKNNEAVSLYHQTHVNNIP